MATDRRLHWRLGLFLMIGGIALATLIIMFTGKPALFRPGESFTAVFPEAPGVQRGTPVRRSGVTVGEVDSLDLDPRTGIVRLSLRLDPDFPPRANEDVILTRNLISGDATVDFVPRDPQQRPIDLGEPIPPGSELVGLAAPRADDLMREAQLVLPTAQQSLNQIRQSVQKLEALTPKLEEALNAFRDLGRSGAELIPELRRTNDELRDFVSEVRDSRPAILKTNDQLQELLANASGFVEELRVIVQREEPKVARLLDRTDEALASVNEVLGEKNRRNLERIIDGATDTVSAINELLSETNRKNVERIIEGATDTVSAINDVLAEPNRRNIEKAIRNAGDASERFAPLARSAEDTLTQLRRSVERIDASLTEAEAILKDVRKGSEAFGTRTESILANVDTSAAEVNKILLDVRAIFREAARSDGTVARLLGDPSLYQNLDAVACGVAKLLPRIESVLADVEVFADKIARHPERLGVGGAVRPDTGLKEGAAEIPPAQTGIFPRLRGPH